MESLILAYVELISPVGHSLKGRKPLGYMESVILPSKLFPSLLVGCVSIKFNL